MSLRVTHEVLHLALRDPFRIARSDHSEGDGVTTLYVTHDQVEAMTLGHRIAVLNDGVLQQVGAPLDVYRNPANLFVARATDATASSIRSKRLR